MPYVRRAAISRLRDARFASRFAPTKKAASEKKRPLY
jgi:hypothetical protein